jgi:NADPH:quinone reductase-like Zn-dependent oxidoreductase
MLAKKELQDNVFGVYPLRNAGDTHMLLERGKTVGKLVLRMAD